LVLGSDFYNPDEAARKLIETMPAANLFAALKLTLD
jgi:hypothetical protein